MKTATLDELLEDFDLFDEWEERYAYIIELGQGLDAMPPELKTEVTRVLGCVSNVWVVSEIEPGDPPILRFVADSDSQIVRGLVAILLMLCSNRTPQEILELDLESVFDQLELRKHLSRSRSNGFHSMIKRIKRLAEEHATS